MSSIKVASILIRFGAVFIFFSSISGFADVVVDKTRENLSKDIQMLISEVQKIAEEKNPSTRNLNNQISMEYYKKVWKKTGITLVIILTLLSLALFYYSDKVGKILIKDLPISIDIISLTILILRIFSLSLFILLSVFILSVILVGDFMDMISRDGIILVLMYIFGLCIFSFAKNISRVFTWKIINS